MRQAKECAIHSLQKAYDEKKKEYDLKKAIYEQKKREYDERIKELTSGGAKNEGSYIMSLQATL